ncbi:hypothetical protein Poly41_50090 [Novipirellula artificiosorum]|uniref:Uncharacterized protein n=2 Tax=Novipirellula artificiosorum TaxID=2528016 RepID=A0A5C6DBU1_9BACT|nr:hypothetical protein Poly41_50090 [Novipirellula artificiosorum]
MIPGMVHATAPACRLDAATVVECSVDVPGVQLAADDLRDDLLKVFGVAAESPDTAPTRVVISIDATQLKPESYRVSVSETSIKVIGADRLGAIYGMYHICQDVLGVDPYWYFKDLLPERRQSIHVPVGDTESEDPMFRYRGWFVNDEDLLTEWKKPNGPRDIRYPFYHQVTSVEVIDRVCEACLRGGGNLIIPASFIYILNDTEADLIRRAVRRGLYVSQHHIEPLGVSHFGFENYWKERGKEEAFLYGSNPEKVREVWRASARRWYEIAGDQVVWQLGLRGKGDTAIWNSDNSVNREQGGKLISQAIAEQWEMVKEIDQREEPPATTTLFLEGSELMSEGSLEFPEGIMVVFSDHGETQLMQDDFHHSKRYPQYGYGAYYHLAFWSSGPHLLQGSKPAKIHDVLTEVAINGDLDYVIFNVSNVREHVLGIQASMEMTRNLDEWKIETFWDRFAPSVLHDPYQELHDCLFDLGPGRAMQDAAVFKSAKAMLARYERGDKNPVGMDSKQIALRQRQLGDAIERIGTLIDNYPASELTRRERAFHDIHFLMQARLWRELYRYHAAMIQAQDDPIAFTEAAKALEQFLSIRQQAAEGKWHNWYRGDKKVNVPSLLKRTKELVQRRASSIQRPARENSVLQIARQVRDKGLQVTSLGKLAPGLSHHDEESGTARKWERVQPVLGVLAERVLVKQLGGSLGGNTSVRNRSEFVWKDSGYYRRARDLGQVFTAPCNFTLDAIVLRTGNSDLAFLPGAANAEVFVQFFKVVGTPVIDDNGTPPGTDATHGFSKNHRCDDTVRGVMYESLCIIKGGRLPDLTATGDGKLTYLKWDFTHDETLRFQKGKQYAFMIGFSSAGSERNFTLSNRNLAADPGPALIKGAGDNYSGGWGLRREGNGKNPPTMFPGEGPPEDATTRKQLRAESAFPTDEARFAIPPTCEGYPDVDTYRDLEFFLIAK